MLELAKNFAAESYGDSNFAQVCELSLNCMPKITCRKRRGIVLQGLVGIRAVHRCVSFIEGHADRGMLCKLYTGTLKSQGQATSFCSKCVLSVYGKRDVDQANHFATKPSGKMYDPQVIKKILCNIGNNLLVFVYMCACVHVHVYSCP